MANKKIIIFAGILICFSVVASLVSATNYYNYVYNGTMWVPMLSTADGQKKVWIEMKNCSYGNVQEDLVVGGNVDSEGNVTLGQKIIFDLGEMIDNIVDGWVRVTGSLNVTGDVVTSGDMEIGGDISGFGVVPIGSISAWHKSFTNTPALPDGWVECNGQVLSDADSVYNGQTIPDLNGDGRFLRGNSTSGTLQADEFKSHNHNPIKANVHTGGSSVDAQVAFNNGYPDNGIGELANIANIDAQRKIPYGLHYMANTGGDETRPINMAVVWIIRVK